MKSAWIRFSAIQTTEQYRRRARDVLRRLLEGRIPDDCLPIAHCGGDLILLTGGRIRRAISAKSGSGIEADEMEGDNIHWVADSFAEFLSMLQYDTT